jgi:hypothetical protein
MKNIKRMRCCGIFSNIRVHLINASFCALCVCVLGKFLPSAILRIEKFHIHTCMYMYICVVQTCTVYFTHTGTIIHTCVHT